MERVSYLKERLEKFEKEGLFGKAIDMKRLSGKKKVKNLEKQYIKMFWRVKERRETAQYSVGEEVGKRSSEEVKDDTTKFFQRLSKLYEEIGE